MLDLGFEPTVPSLGLLVAATLGVNALLLAWAWLVSPPTGGEVSTRHGPGTTGDDDGPVDGDGLRCPNCGASNGPYRYCRRCVTPLEGWTGTGQRATTPGGFVR
jgi:hypothetical protein